MKKKEMILWLCTVRCLCTLLAALWVGSLAMYAQSYTFTIDWSEMETDSLLPCWSVSLPLPDSLAGRGATVVVEYPELGAVGRKAPYLAALQRSGVGEWPVVSVHEGVSARQASLDVALVPVILRDGRYWAIRSLDLRVVTSGTSAEVANAIGTRPVQAPSSAEVAHHSLLASGHWEKVAVCGEDGLCQIGREKLAAMGFRDPNKVRVFGYGGHRLPEWDLEQLPDDLPEVPVYHDGGHIVFYAHGTVSWEQKADGTWTHTQNPYAREGYYFLTDSDSLRVGAPRTVVSLERLLPPMPMHGHALVEKEEYAFYHSGRQLFENYDYQSGAVRHYDVELPALLEGGTATVTVSFAHNGKNSSSLSVAMGDKALGTCNLPANSAYCEAGVTATTFKTTDLSARTRFTLTHQRAAGVSGRLDFIRISYPIDTVAYKAHLLAHVAEAEARGTVAPQDLHALGATDYLIVVPTSGKLTAEAERLAEAHRQRDGLRTAVVTAEQVYNEFSSGTPDATAIRRCLKMFYDRATGRDDLPRYLLLFGDGAWDNRMLTDNWRHCSPDDYLLCFESENSVSSTRSFVMEDYFALLDPGEGRDLLRDKPDVGVGRLPVTDADEARLMVDKIIAYMDNVAAGGWKNTILMLGDDGDNNQHVNDAEFVAGMIGSCYPQYMLKRIYWDTFPMEVAATGNRYPAVHDRLLELLDEGALMVNYSGHGSADVLSHELVIDKADVASLSSPRLPLWVTASCDISPFDNTITSFGETALLNPKGGAIALFTTARTVFSTYNRSINYLFTKYVFARDEQGRRLRLGDAVCKAKSDIVTSAQVGLQDYSENKLHYVLLGDPALCIGNADGRVVVDAVNGQRIDGTDAITLQAGAVVTVSGHIDNPAGQLAENFDGTVHPTVLDSRETIVGRNNNGSATEPFAYTEHAKMLFAGSDSVRNGTFEFRFRVPMDINYSGQKGLLNLYALSTDKCAEAQGYTEAFLLGGTQPGLANDSTGPTIHLYLNTPQFVSGDHVNETPLLVAELDDVDGINTVGNGIGHDLVAVIDGEASMTYKLNNFYTSSFGDYTHGTVAYSLPSLSEGKHTLMLRAWDLMNNSSTATIDFEVVEGLTPNLTDITVSESPATTETTFIITHDRPGTAVTFRIDISDLSGRILWTSTNSTATTATVYTQTWNLCDQTGAPLATGVYLYRVTVTSATGTSTSQSRKMVIKR